MHDFFRLFFFPLKLKAAEPVGLGFKTQTSILKANFKSTPITPHARAHQAIKCMPDQHTCSWSFRSDKRLPCVASRLGVPEITLFESLNFNVQVSRILMTENYLNSKREVLTSLF